MSPRRARPGQVIAVYPGTFDPVTNGHVDIIERGSRLFDKVLVAILENPEKDPMFTVRERMSLIQASTRHLGNVEVEAFAGLLIDYARARKVRAIVRGLRAVSDFEYELQMAMMNRRLSSEVETVFMMPNEAYSYLSSRLVREVVALGGSVTGLVPKEVESRIVQRAGTIRRRLGSAPHGAPGGEGSAVGATGTGKTRGRLARRQGRRPAKGKRR
ncbi:MAG TPA: pantetheine-phosphate adenylyltransferase [Candidatus Saccharimonadales bacterium]|nr:pantetheine-phosphate adenylyltransferase [Candidatus Saccharimonadales bacterium]